MSTVKVKIDKDEEYPVYDLTVDFNSSGTEKEIPAELLERWTKVSTEFWELNAQIGDILDGDDE